MRLHGRGHALWTLLWCWAVLASMAASHVGAQSGGYAPQELDDLVAPIALYPDPLLSQVLAASTFPDQIKEAAALVKSQGPSGIETRKWEANVRAVAGYPEVLNMLADAPEWTAALGWAVTNQQREVLASVQRLRQQAQQAGNLASTPEQRVMVQDQVVQIIPAQPEVIYVPQYDPAVVYVDRGPYLGDVGTLGLITFGVGYTVGRWVDPFDWHHSDWHYPPPLHRYPYGARPPYPPYRPGGRPPGPGTRPPGVGGRPPVPPGTRPPISGTRPPGSGLRPPMTPGVRPPVPGTLPSRPAFPSARPPGGMIPRPPISSAPRPSAPALRPSPDFGRPSPGVRPSPGSAFGGYQRPGQVQQYSDRGRSSLGAARGGFSPGPSARPAPRGGGGGFRGGGGGGFRGGGGGGGRRR